MTFSNKFGNFGFVLFEFLTFSQKNLKKLQILAEISLILWLSLLPVPTDIYV